MSVKDTRFGAPCPICGDYLPGSDDAHIVFDCVKAFIDEGHEGCCCDLCGEDVTSEQAKAIVAAGRPDTGLLVQE